VKVEIRPNLILAAEKELGIVAGLQDRVAQVYGGLVYMVLQFCSLLFIFHNQGFLETVHHRDFDEKARFFKRFKVLILVARNRNLKREKKRFAIMNITFWTQEFQRQSAMAVLVAILRFLDSLKPRLFACNFRIMIGAT